MIRKLTLIFVLFTIILSNSFAILDDGEVYYSFDENNITNQFFGVSGDVGKISGAYNFDGSNDYISSTLTNTNLAGTDLSVSFWFKPDTITAQQLLFSTRGANTSEFNCQTQAGGFGVSNTLFCQWRDSAGNDYLVQTSANSIVAGNWYHVIAYFNSTNGEIDIYLNNVLDNAFVRSSSISAGGLDPNSDNLELGRFHTGGSHFDGSIDEFSIYKRALTSSEKSDLYNSGGGNIVTDILSDFTYYIDGNSLYDFSNNNYFATTQNGVTSNTGLLNNGYDFDGTNDYISSTLTNTNLSGTDLSVSFWFKPDVIGTQHFLFSTNKGSNSQFNCQIGSGGYGVSDTLICEWKDSSANAYVIQTSANSIVAGNWHHVLAYFNSTNGEIDIYLNNVLDNAFVRTSSISAGGLDPNSDNLELGRFHTGISYFDGSIDEFSIYKRALTSSEKSDLYNSGAGFNPYPKLKTEFQNLISYYELNTNSIDSNGRFDGIDSGFPTYTGSYIDFDGVNDFIDTDALWVNSYPFTFSAWVNPDVSSSDATIVAMTDTASFNQWVMMDIDNGIPECTRRTSTQTQAVGTTNITAGSWYYLTCVFESDSSAKIYVNGVLEDTDTTTLALSSVMDKSSIGKNLDSITGDQIFDGGVRDVSIFSKALDVNTINNLYQNVSMYDDLLESLGVSILVSNPVDEFNYTFDVTSVPINITTSGLANCEYNYLGSNTSLSTSDNLTHTGTFNLGNQTNSSTTYDVTFYCTDGNLDVSQSDITFYKQQEPFNLSIIVPQDEQIFVASTQEIQFYLETNYVAICKYNINNTGDVTFTNTNNSIHTTLFSVTPSQLIYNSYFQCDAVNLVESKNRSVIFYLDELQLIQFGYVPVLEESGEGIGNFIASITSPLVTIIITLGIGGAIVIMVRRISSVISNVKLK